MQRMCLRLRNLLWHHTLLVNLASGFPIVILIYLILARIAVRNHHALLLLQLSQFRIANFSLIRNPVVALQRRRFAAGLAPLLISNKIILLSLDFLNLIYLRLRWFGN